MDEIVTPGSEQHDQHEGDNDAQNSPKKGPRISSDLKLFGGLVGGTVAGTAAAYAGAQAYRHHIDRPVNETVQIGAQQQSQEARIAGYNQGKVKFEMTPDGNVLITLPKELVKGLEGLGRELDATVQNPDGSSQSVQLENPEYHGLGHYSADVSTTENGPGGEIAQQENPDSWREMAADPQPGGAPATLDINIDGSKGPHSEYTIEEPPQTPPAVTN